MGAHYGFLRQNISFNLKGSGSGFIADSRRYSQPQIQLFSFLRGSIRNGFERWNRNEKKQDKLQKKAHLSFVNSGSLNVTTSHLQDELPEKINILGFGIFQDAEQLSPSPLDGTVSAFFFLPSLPPAQFARAVD